MINKNYICSCFKRI